MTSCRRTVGLNLSPLLQVSLALGLEAGGWGALVERTSGSGGGGGGTTILGGFTGLAGLARRCGVCLATFPSPWLLERHALLQHAGQTSDDKPFTCEQCGQRYRYRSAYVKHREQNHRARLPADKLFTCDVCGMQFRYLKSFKKHRLNHALERLQRAPESQSASVVVVSAPAERSDQVSSTGEPSQVETGSDTTNPGDVEEMRGVFSESVRGGDETSVSETASVQENPGDAVEVQLTETTAPSGTGVVTAGGGRDAGGTSSEVGDVDDNAVDDDRSHEVASEAIISLARTGTREADRRERRFACPFCGKCVRSKENLKLHVRKHTGERPFVCLFCGRAFGGKSDLTRHLRIHTGERPYHCEMCGKCFARADYLSKHLTTHIHQR